ncbi:hypothetical protein BDQ17DRAFT_1428761 [Cyathus striatus]|nr:hypothetical protein BDQ17DRAFT_1428761 [Cyathus striatus]
MANIDHAGSNYFFPPDIASLLTSNSAPSDSQLRETKDILNGYLTSLNKIESEIQQQKAILEDLYAKRTQKQHQVASCSFVLSPIRRIPSELLAKIFQHALPWRGKMSFREAPLLLLRVCKTWRDVAMSEPHLWRDLEIKAVSSQGGLIASRGKKYALNAAHWFRRARSLPLSFHLSFHVARVLSGFTSEDVEDCRPFFQTFVEQSDVFLGRLRS